MKVLPRKVSLRSALGNEHFSSILIGLARIQLMERWEKITSEVSFELKNLRI
jgi:hypothetical protein